MTLRKEVVYAVGFALAPMVLWMLETQTESRELGVDAEISNIFLWFNIRIAKVRDTLRSCRMFAKGPSTQ